MTKTLPPEIAALVDAVRAYTSPGRPYRHMAKYVPVHDPSTIVATLRAVADNLLHRSDGYVLDPRKTDWMPLMAGLVLGRVAREYREMADRIERGEGGGVTFRFHDKCHDRKGLNMGLFDYVEFEAPCSGCGAPITEWQTKSTEDPYLKVVTPEEIPGGRLIGSCPHCRTFEHYRVRPVGGVVVEREEMP